MQGCLQGSEAYHRRQARSMPVGGAAASARAERRTRKGPDIAARALGDAEWTIYIQRTCVPLDLVGAYVVSPPNTATNDCHVFELARYR